MTIFTTFVSLTRLTALAAGTLLLAAADGASAKYGVVEVPAALNPEKLSIFRVVSARGVQVYTCTRNPAGATGWILKGPDAHCSIGNPKYDHRSLLFRPTRAQRGK